MFALARFWLPTRPHLQPHPPSAHPPPIDTIRDITAIEKIKSNTRGIQIACRIAG